MRKIVFISIISLIIIFGAMWFFMHRQTQGYNENLAIKAIPVKTPLIIEAPDILSLVKKLEGSTTMMEELKGIPEFQPVWGNLEGFGALVAENDDLKNILKNKQILMAFNLEGKDHIGCLFAFNLKNRAERSDMLAFLENYSKQEPAVLSKRMYDNVEIFKLRKGQAEYHFAEDNGIFLFSRYGLFIDEAIRQISAENLLDNERFRDLYNTVSSSSDLNIFVNHEKIFQFMTKVASPDFRNALQQFAKFADWTELDINIKDSEILFSGFSFSGPLSGNYTNVFKNQNPGRFGMDKMMPAGTSMFINLNISDFKSFQNDYSEFLKKKQGNYYRRETSLKELERFFKKPVIPLFQEIAGEDFTLVFGQVTLNEPSANRFFIAGVKSQSMAKEALLTMLENYAKTKNTEVEKMTTTWRIQDSKNFLIYEFPFGNFPELLMGETFSAVTGNYLCFYDNYLIFADNLAAMKSYIHDLELSNTLAKDSRFQKFNQQMASKSTFYSYVNFPRSFYLSNYYLNKDMSKAVKANEAGVRKFHGAGWQFSANSGEMLNNIYLNFDPVLKEEPRTVWQAKLDSSILRKPQFVINHNDSKNMEALVQDAKNNLYLINSEGASLWKIKLSGKIMSDIFQVDYYRNGKLQYLFNTQNKLYLIDRNGNNVAKFPVNLKATATNGVNVFDYNSNRDYRFFVACDDHKIYAYDRDGKTISGWNFEKTEGPVTNPVKHFRVGEKDYLVFADKFKTYVLDRQGDTRLQTDNFEHSGNDIYLNGGDAPAMVTTDTAGKLHLQYFDGKSATIDPGRFGAEHYFITADLNGDKKTDYIIAHDKKLYALTDKGKKLFEKKLGSRITEKPCIFEFGENNKKIGVVCGDENRIYLVDTKGEGHQGFPLQGNTGFSIGVLSKGTPYYNLLVGNSDALINYKIEP